MANRQRGEVSLAVDGGKTYTLRPSVNALCAAEDKAGGLTTSELMLRAANGSMTATRIVLWAYLQEHHAKEFSTVEQVGDLIDLIGLGSVTAQLSAVADLNTPTRDQEAAAGVADAADPQAAQDGTGAGSSLPRAATA
jgi:hypothetical protein